MKPCATPKTGVLIVAHGERGGNSDNVALLSLAERVAQILVPSALVAPAVLNGTPALSDAVSFLKARGCLKLTVYPLFMSAGYFTSVRLPRQLADYCGAMEWQVVAPLGLDANLPELICRRAREAAERPLDSENVLIVAHGSRTSPESAMAAQNIASSVRASGLFASVESAFLEEPPFLDDVIAAADTRRLVIGLFAGDGRHARNDVLEALEATSHVYLGAVGTWPEIADLVASRLRP